jgi:hydroxymethylglutaryl-CoA reductase
VSGEILARSLRSETDIAKDARYRESLRAARSAAQVVIDATAEPRTMASVPLAQAFAALAMLAHMAGMEGEEKTMRAFVDVATADAATSYQRAWLDEEQMKRKELEKAARVDVL